MAMLSSSPPTDDDEHAVLVEYNDQYGGGDAKEPLLLGSTSDYNGASFVRSCFNGINALSGVGILSIPYALSEGGWLSLVLLLMVAVICCYTGLLLQRCMEVDPHIQTYPDIGELAFGYKGKLAVSIFMYLELYLVATEFLILEGDNLHKLLPITSVQVGTFNLAGKQLFVVLVALMILPTTWLRSLGVLAYVSAGGVLASLVVLGSVLWAATFDGVGFHKRGRMLRPSGLPTAMGLYAFCFCGHAVFPTVCNSMKHKKQFSKVLILCFVVCTLNYGSMAVLGYLMYGEELESQVTLNLPLGKLSTKIAICTTLINPFTKYALMITPIADAIEKHLLVFNKTSAALFIRSLLVLSTLVIALAIPFFGYLTALIGSFLSIIVSVLFPCICYLKIFKTSQSNVVELVIITGIMLFSILFAIMGTYSSLWQIIQEI